MVIAYLTRELSALNVIANQYMSSSLTSIKRTVISASPILEKDILATFVSLITLLAQFTANQKSDMLTYANSIKIECGKFTPEVTEIYGNVQLLQPLALAADSAAEQAKLVADAAAKAAAAALMAAKAATAAADNATSLKSTKQAAAKKALDSASEESLMVASKRYIAPALFMASAVSAMISGMCSVTCGSTSGARTPRRA